MAEPPTSPEAATPPTEASIQPPATTPSEEQISSSQNGKETIQYKYLYLAKLRGVSSIKNPFKYVIKQGTGSICWSASNYSDISFFGSSLFQFTKNSENLSFNFPIS